MRRTLFRGLAALVSTGVTMMAFGIGPAAAQSQPALPSVPPSAATATHGHVHSSGVLRTLPHRPYGQPVTGGTGVGVGGGANATVNIIVGAGADLSSVANALTALLAGLNFNVTVGAGANAAVGAGADVTGGTDTVITSRSLLGSVVGTVH